MANTFKRYTSRDVGTSLTAVGSYTVSSGTQVTVIGVTVANTTSSSVQVDVTHYDGSNDTYIVQDAPVPVGSSLVVVGGDQKLVLEPNDQVRVNSNASSSVDVVMSVLEIT